MGTPYDLAGRTASPPPRFEDCHEAEVVDQLHRIWGVLPHALDPDDARRLWEVCEQMLAAARADRTGQRDSRSASRSRYA